MKHALILLAVMGMGIAAAGQTGQFTYSLVATSGRFDSGKFQIAVPIYNGVSLQTHMDTVRGLLKFYFDECGNEEIAIDGYEVIETSYDQFYYPPLKKQKILHVASNKTWGCKNIIYVDGIYIRDKYYEFIPYSQFQSLK